MAVKDAARCYEFGMGFISNSESYRKQYLDTWREVLANFTVSPTWENGYSTPYREGRVYTSKSSRTVRDQILLKDPETHKAIMMYASKLVRVLFSARDRGYIKARPRGYEDADVESPTVSRLLRYAFGLPGHFRTMVEAVVDMLLFGTSIIEVGWKYEEREMPVRTVENELGIETESFSRIRVPVYDDVRLNVVDVFDFYPDPSRYRLQDMAGAAKRFRMNALEARAKSEAGIYDTYCVENAIKNLGKSDNSQNRESFREGLDQPTDRYAHSDFKDMIGYEYWGDVPWEDDQGSSRRVITILNNEVVQNRAWPLSDPCLPFHSMIINPLQGRFYGISPGETIRFNQDFIDALLILLAEAVIRQVHPPIAVDQDGDVDIARVKAWKADTIITARGGPNAVGTLRYDANVQSAFALMGGLKDSAQQAMGSLGGIQGEPGPDREAASVGVQRVQMALDRPELAAMVIEQECLPPIGIAILRRYQQFIDTEGLKMRIGELPESAWIGDIMLEHDVEFVGSRVAMTNQEKLQAIDRLSAMSQAIPPLQMLIPWDRIGTSLIGDLLELPEIAALIADPNRVAFNALVMGAMGGKGGPAQNGVPSQAEPAGMLPAQAGGGMVEGG